ncbi:MAG: DegV family protein [Clostridia bacterium]|nr:DegV family protein [Clostridia bacterium]
MKIAISTESTVDVTEEIKNKYNLKIVPFTVLLGDDAEPDGKISGKDVIAYVDKTGKLPKTSAVNRKQYEEHFKNVLKEYDAVVHIALSSEISSACANAKTVAENLENVFVVDSRSLSTGVALLCIYAYELAEKGLGAEEIAKKCEKRVPFVQASFVLKRLDYLYKGGRCSALAFFGANVLRIRPQIILKNGKMQPGRKFRGNFDQCIKKYVEGTLEDFSSPDLSHVFITYTTADEQTLENVRDILTARGFKDIMITRANATITSHCGENCLGILYINDGKAEK